jgi:exodeoxyribonuclease (lambda-induced)
MSAVFAPQRSKEWFDARRGIPTCSSFARIVTPAQGKPSAQQDAFMDELIAESLGKTDEQPQRVTLEMELGMKLEAEARNAYAFEHAKGAVEECGFRLAPCGLYGGSPDLLCGEEGGAEFKCPSASVQIGYIRENVLPAIYRPQVHGYMLVTGRKWWDFYSYHQGLPSFHVRVIRGDFTNQLEAELLAFCARYNEAREKFGLKPLGTAKT